MVLINFIKIFNFKFLEVYKVCICLVMLESYMFDFNLFIWYEEL